MFLQNAVKHSDATQISISLKRWERQLVLEIVDNGRGFDVKSALSGQDSPGGGGLASMIERAEIVGGLLLIDSAPEKGTRIRMVLSQALLASDAPLDQFGPG